MNAAGRFPFFIPSYFSIHSLVGGISRRATLASFVFQTCLCFYSSVAAFLAPCGVSAAIGAAFCLLVFTDLPHFQILLGIHRLAKGADGMATRDLCETSALFAVNEQVHGQEAVFKTHRPESEDIERRTRGVPRFRVVISHRHAVWPKAPTA